MHISIIYDCVLNICYRHINIYVNPDVLNISYYLYSMYGNLLFLGGGGLCTPKLNNFHLHIGNMALETYLNLQIFASSVCSLLNT